VGIARTPQYGLSKKVRQSTIALIAAFALLIMKGHHDFIVATTSSIYVLSAQKWHLMRDVGAATLWCSIVILTDTAIGATKGARKDGNAMIASF
jgi:hypothetical protein